MSEKAKMLRGELYVADDPELEADHARCQELLQRINATAGHDGATRAPLLRELFGAIGENSDVKPPLRCDYGYPIGLGRDVFVNYGAVILDPVAVEIGDAAKLGPNVQLLTPDHPREPALRRQFLERALPIRIGANTWLGGGVIVGPGVTIGDDTIVGAGSVVVRDLPAGVVAAGNPARILREL